MFPIPLSFIYMHVAPHDLSALIRVRRRCRTAAHSVLYFSACPDHMVDQCITVLASARDIAELVYNGLGLAHTLCSASSNLLLSMSSAWVTLLVPSSLSFISLSDAARSKPIACVVLQSINTYTLSTFFQPVFSRAQYGVASLTCDDANATGCF
ncbi:hypothetical protein HETIRDRAFT_454537 [Heterobasidion irregulare TC 32-1]|uniref:F-box domain-containing protein n=1 Tax=Heterobasidion irregulare (strain TC 32-1) TaxID=747525 RepID=W4JUE3_HETIT|nr:uncharacterized protein HETIRDRAFT_454537 [Heterobasidion irregulare TC 32-1]ETW77173.1 hypothetical protein HETIRDRAFT_454537 [Heterobasidion irregulare TC 32-1]